MFSDLLHEIKNGKPIMEKWDAINYLIKLKSFYDDKMSELFKSNMNNKASYAGLKTEYDLLMEKYDDLRDKWEQFSKCLDMGPEKFISMLDDLKENIKSKGNEIAQLREQLKTTELDAERYKNDGIQDRVKLQEVTEELEKIKKLMDTPCKEVIELIDNLKQMNDDKMDTIAKLEANLIAANKDKEMMLSYYAKELESIIKMRDNWKADCEYNEKCFQAERDRRWELEEEVKQLKKQLMESEVCNSDYIRNKKELDELTSKKLSIFENPRLNIDNRWDGYCSIDLINGNKIKFIDMIKGYIDKDALDIFDRKSSYSIYDHRTDDYLYSIDKNTYNIEKISHLKVEAIDDDNNCECLCKKCKKKKTKIYVTIGLHKVLVDTVDHEVNYTHYRLYEDLQKCCIIKKDGFRKDFKNYSIDKNTLEVKVID